MSKSKSITARCACAILALAAGFLAAGNAYSYTEVRCEVWKTGDTCRSDLIWQASEDKAFFTQVQAVTGDFVAFEIYVQRRHARDLKIYSGSTDRDTKPVLLGNPLRHGNMFTKITKYVAADDKVPRHPRAQVVLYTFSH